LSDSLKITVDQVNHPPHYTQDPSGVECIQITRHRNFNVGNAFKYLWRAGLKDQAKTIQDLEKAIFYIQDEIKRLEGKF
jgi:hypothetical protein